MFLHGLKYVYCHLNDILLLKYISFLTQSLDSVKQRDVMNVKGVFQVNGQPRVRIIRCVCALFPIYCVFHLTIHCIMWGMGRWVVFRTHCHWLEGCDIRHSHFCKKTTFKSVSSRSFYHISFHLISALQSKGTTTVALLGRQYKQLPQS